MGVSIVKLIASAISLILAGVESKNAVERIADDYNIDFSTLWNELPDIFK